MICIAAILATAMGLPGTQAESPKAAISIAVVQKAKLASDQFRTNLKLEAPVGAPLIHRAWFVTDPQAVVVSYGSWGSMTLDHTGSTVLSYVNDARLQQQLEDSRDGKARPMPSESLAQKWAQRMQGRLSIPNSYRLARLTIEPYDPSHGEANTAGVIGVSFERQVNGQSCFNYVPAVRLQLDPLDGAVVTYDMCPGPTVSGHQSLSSADAITRANTIASRFGAVKSVAKPALGYAVSNGEFGSADATETLAGRLAWRVDYGAVVVWIDAENGDCLGGQRFK